MYISVPTTNFEILNLIY